MKAATRIWGTVAVIVVLGLVVTWLVVGVRTPLLLPAA